MIVVGGLVLDAITRTLSLGCLTLYFFIYIYLTFFHFL